MSAAAATTVKAVAVLKANEIAGTVLFEQDAKGLSAERANRRWRARSPAHQRKARHLGTLLTTLSLHNARRIPGPSQSQAQLLSRE
jgi:hypothetical protein